MTDYRWTGSEPDQGGHVQPDMVVDIDDTFTVPKAGYVKITDETSAADPAGGDASGEKLGDGAGVEEAPAPSSADTSAAPAEPSTGGAPVDTQSVSATSGDEQVTATATVTAPPEQPSASPTLVQADQPHANPAANVSAPAEHAPTPAQPAEQPTAAQPGDAPTGSTTVQS